LPAADERQGHFGCRIKPTKKGLQANVTAPKGVGSVTVLRRPAALSPSKIPPIKRIMESNGKGLGMSSGHTDHPRRLAAGFTLIEVVIVVAIIAILASVALPSYTRYVLRGQLQEAFTNLADQRIRLEQYYQDNRSYGPASGSTCFGTGNSAITITGSRYFTYSCATTGSGQAYTITATGVTGSATAGYAYTLTDSGARATTSYAGSTVTTSCWAIKSSTDCS
jgi:type IV pilus assembly protein PilE